MVTCQTLVTQLFAIPIVKHQVPTHQSFYDFVQTTLNLEESH